MSRGLGVVQRWLVKQLPNAGKPRSVETLAMDYFATTTPTATQLSSVRRALRGLEEQGRVAGTTRRSDRRATLLGGVRIEMVWVTLPPTG